VNAPLLPLHPSPVGAAAHAEFGPRCGRGLDLGSLSLAGDRLVGRVADAMVCAWVRRDRGQNWVSLLRVVVHVQMRGAGIWVRDQVGIFRLRAECFFSGFHVDFLLAPRALNFALSC
jgi:hypothetical protein